MAWLKKPTPWLDARGLSTLAATLLAIPFTWEGLTGFYAWLSPFIMLNSVFVLKSVVWLNGLAFLVLIITILRKRWFCKFLCPVGWGCDLVSSFSRQKCFSVKKVPSIGKWLAAISLVSSLAGFPLFIILDPMSIFNGFFSVFSEEMAMSTIIPLSGLPILLALHLYFPGIWCSKLCPLGGLQVGVLNIKNLIIKNQEKNDEEKEGIKIQRRFFLASGTGLLAGLVLPGFMHPNEKRYLRPPGAISEKLFNILCLRCGSCIKSCPTNILIHRKNMEDPLSWMVPEIRFQKGYCLENCNLCSRVCSSGAITLFSPDAKSQVPIGMARINLENCLLAKYTECDRCKIACTYKAITIEIEKETMLMLPVVHEDKCIGCGACAVICPPETIQLVPYSRTL